MNQIDYRFTKLEDEVRALKAQLELERTERKNETILHEEVNRRQAIFIKVLQILQSSDDLPAAMNEALAEIGRYAGVCRVHVIEKIAGGTALNNTLEWCKEGVEPIKEKLQHIPMKLAPWFDMFENGKYIYTSDNRTNIPELNELMDICDVKSLAVFPLSSGSTHYGFVDFNVCTDTHVWDENEVELLKSISQILSATKARFQIETSLYRSHQTMQTLLNNTNAIILVTDFETLKILFVNDTLRKLTGEDVIGKECWKVLQLGKNEACEWCPKKFLLGKKCPTEVYRFEHPFEIVNKHLAIDAMAIEWIDGRKALMEVCFDITKRKYIEQQLVLERDRLQAIGDNFPNGSLFRVEINTHTMQMKLSYVSGTWEKITGISIEDSLADISNLWAVIFPEDLQRLKSEIVEKVEANEHFNFEIRFVYKGTETRWLQLSTHRRKVAADEMISDGYILDITQRKKADIELEKYRNRLELLVRERTEELEVSNEELSAVNEELDRYKTQLEEMVEEKTSQLTARQKDLEKLTRRQNILINALQIMQSAKSLPQAMNEMLAEIGNFVGVSRVNVFEKNDDETTFNCTHEWDNRAIMRAFEDHQNRPIEDLQPWFDVFEAGGIINSSDSNISDIQIHTPYINTVQKKYGVKSFLILPLTDNRVHYGLVGFDDCTGERVWDENEVELLKSLSQIISATKLRYHAEQELVMERDRLQAIGDNFPNGSLFRFDINPQNMKMNFSYLSATWEEVMGIGIEETKAEISKAFETILPEYVEPIIEEIARCTTSLEHFMFEYQKYHKGNEIRWILASSFPHRISEDKVVFDGFALDITARKLAEIELVHAKEKAEESDKLKSAFLANMSHEIRTPLNAIVGFLKVITYGDLTPQREQDYFNIINKSASQLTKLIDDIIDVSKIESNQLNIFPVPVNINQMMTELQIYYETYLQNNNKEHIMLILDDSGFIDNCTILVDSIRLHQILNNLIGNAVKFTEKGYIRFGYRQSAPDKLEFVVEDTGIGMALDKYEIVFERFWKTGTHFYEGVGLGLNIAHSLVQMMGGEIWLETTEGVGSTFYFTILYSPVHQEEKNE